MVIKAFCDTKECKNKKFKLIFFFLSRIGMEGLKGKKKGDITSKTLDSFPTGNHMFKVNKRNITTRCENTNLEHISNLAQVDASWAMIHFFKFSQTI